MSSPSIALGLVLAGGASSRMGRDKAVLPIGGLRLIDRVIERVAPVCAEVVVAPGGDRAIAELGVRVLPDAVPEAGPLGGIVSGLEDAASRDAASLVAVVAVDLPFVDASLLGRLAGMLDADDDAGAVAPVYDGRLQPLHAVWRAATGARLRDHLMAGGRRVVEAFEHVGGRAVEMPDGPYARNLNTPADLAWLDRYGNDDRI